MDITYELRVMLRDLYLAIWELPWPLPIIVFSLVGVFGLYFVLYLCAPIPRPPYRSERTYRTVLPDGSISDHEQLPCWLDRWRASKDAARKDPKTAEQSDRIDEGDLFISVVVPAYNEEDRLGGMLEEAVDFLQRAYGDAHGPEIESSSPSTSSASRNEKDRTRLANGSANCPRPTMVGRGWEILIVSDGSTDKTVETALGFARDHQLSQYPVPVPGPRTPNPTHSTKIPHGSIRVISLLENRGKGGAVTHGMRHARGKYVVFADADGATKFDDLEKLVERCRAVEDSQGRGIAIGSRAHLVGSEAVVKRSAMRNFLMHGFHLFLRLMTPPATSGIKDTQCGFKLFSRPSLPYIVPFMHSEGWIFDVEMLMLAESAKIAVAEVAVGWKEVKGSKLHVVWDSVGMAWGLTILRAAWASGVYSRS